VHEVNLSCRYQRKYTDKRRWRSREQLQHHELRGGIWFLLQFHAHWSDSTSRQGPSLLYFSVISNSCCSSRSVSLRSVNRRP